MKTAQKIRRQERILLTLDKLTYSTIEQLQIIEDLKGYRNAHRILHEMEKDKLIGSVRHEKKIYYLSNRGGEQIGKSNPNVKKSLIQHTLMRNDLYIKLGMPKTWKKEAPIIINDKVVLISDARFKRNGRYYFVEIDNKQAMRTNYEKIKKYSEVFKMIRKQFNYNPQLIWYTLSDVRKEKLIKECQKNAVSYKIY